MKTIQPRQDFLQSQDGNPFAELVGLPSFLNGIRAALLQFQITSQSRGQTWEQAARAHDYLEGAKDFAQYLLTFAESEPKQPQPTTENLQWQTKQSLRHPPKTGRK